METICTSDEFCGRRDPYTGAPLTVKLFILKGGVARYRIEGGYDVATRHATMEAAADAWSRVGGVAGLRDPSGGFVCAYTGSPLSPASGPDGFWFSGGFAPDLFHTREEVLEAFARLDGRPAPAADARVEAVPDAPPPPRFHEHDIPDEAFDRAETLVDSARELIGAAPAAPVSMSVPTKRRRR